MNFFGIGGLELIVIAGLAFFVLGPKKMIETSRSAGKLIRELKAERDKFTKMVMTEFDTEDEKPAGSPGSSGGGAPKAAPPATPDEAPEGAVSRPMGRQRNMSDFGDPGGPPESDEPRPDEPTSGDVSDDDEHESPESRERESA